MTLHTASQTTCTTGWTIMIVLENGLEDRKYYMFYIMFWKERK